MSTLVRTSDAQSFIRRAKSCALHPESSGGTCGSGDDSVRIVGKWKSKELEFQKEYLKLVGEEPASVMTSEMEKLKDFRVLLRSSRFSIKSATNV
jgi:hypothetical protein